MPKGIKVRVSYTGKAHIRIVDQYEWNVDNGYIQPVTSQAMVDRLLANGDFELVQKGEAQAENNQEDSQL